ncbi:MAG: aminopeptidase P N-terminal domain-containing protein [Gemmatimonadales bacterium]
MRPSLALVGLTALLAAAALHAQEGRPLFTTDFPAEEFATRRMAVARAIGPDAVALLQGAPSPSGYTRFRQSNDFYYLSGIESPGAYLLIQGGSGRATLYLPHRNPARERGEGKLLSAEDGELVRDLAGIDELFGPELLGEHLARMVNRTPRTLFTPFAPAEGAAMSRDLALRSAADAASDPWDGRPTREQHFLDLLRTRLPRFGLADLSPTLDSLRLIKSDREIALLRKATTLSGLALMEAMRSTTPGVSEFELDALAKFIYHRNGASEDSYYSLIGSAGNAWYPHYHANGREMQDGDLVLMDYAPNVGYYNADVTRMFPVNGRFSPAQRELYGFYLACYEAILQPIRPGVLPTKVKQEALASMERILASWRFGNPAHERAARQFVSDYAGSAATPGSGLGHWVGMATHDDGPSGGVLQAGMVFTIEPALRVPEERIYIRLEDMIVVTPTGAEVLSGFVPRSIEAIERLMREDGILQRYPRAPTAIP